jgi:4-amino-4-deoxychorismate lyase
VYLYLNGEMVASEHATISIFDHGYLYGVGLFETFRTYNGHPFLLENHLDRLELGCEQVGMVWVRDTERIREQITTLLQSNQLEDGYFRLNVSAGSQPIGLPSEPYTRLTEALFVKELPQRITEKRLSTVKTKRNTPEGSQRLKSHHYLNNILAKQETPLNAEGVFLTAQGKVAEGIVSNLFFIRQGELFTPALTTGILNGITRECVLHLANKLGLHVHQGEYDLVFAREADEVFVTNSIQEIMPVIQWDEQVYASQNEVSLTQRIKQEYDRYKERIHRIDEITSIHR